MLDTAVMIVHAIALYSTTCRKNKFETEVQPKVKLSDNVSDGSLGFE